LPSLACYVYAEMPPLDWLNSAFQGDIGKLKGKARADKIAEKVRIAKEITKAVQARVQNRPSHPVGQLYNRIIDIIQDPEKIADSEFRTDSYRFQSCWDDWGRGYQRPPDGSVHGDNKHSSHVLIEQMGSRTEALAGLRKIAGQGE